MVTQPPIEGNLDCRARPFHSELCFDIATLEFSLSLGVLSSATEVSYGALVDSQGFFLSPCGIGLLSSMTTNQVRDPTVIHFTIDGRHGILGARHIAEALHIPYEPARPEDFEPGSSFTERHPLVQRRGVLLEAFLGSLRDTSLALTISSWPLFCILKRRCIERSCSKQMPFHFSSPNYYARYWSTWDIQQSLNMSVYVFSSQSSQLTYLLTLRPPAPVVAPTEHIPEVPPSAPQATPQPPPIIPPTSEPSPSTEPRILYPLSSLISAPEHVTPSPSEPAQAPSFIHETTPPEEPTTGEGRGS
ncbi:hypothetical protein CK203_042016 [Vitis vinifera]|uniref:Uncharacterized protein n=1 Tax=Vitis vinifera TaxID=29760 RepID=A0A438I0J3_VITVI|nr:hypothetical protein CK203_042016 [Vitis vinifera]